MSSCCTKSQALLKSRAILRSSFGSPENIDATKNCKLPCKHAPLRASVASSLFLAIHLSFSLVRLRCSRAHIIITRRPSLLISKAGLGSDDNSEEKPKIQSSEKKGTILGAASLIIGTSIGSGILALPQKTSPAGFIPSATSIILCWVFLVIEALLLAELNIVLRKKRKKDEDQEGDLEVVSLRTMAQETLGGWGGNLAAVAYLFLGYTCMVAYTSKSGEVLSHFISLPAPVLGNLFTLLLALVILVGGIDTTDRVNQWLTVAMIGLLAIIEAISLSFGYGSAPSVSNWEKAPQAIPVIIFTLVYHDIEPVICAYLGGDLRRIRLSIIVGSLVPLISLLVWENIALGISSNVDGSDPLELLTSERWRSMTPMVETFSILAVGTSLIGTLLSCSQFFVEQLVNLYVYAQDDPETGGDGTRGRADDSEDGKWSRDNNLSVVAFSIVILPSIFISTVTSDAFAIATDVAGGYCMMVLYGILPPAMAWARLSGREVDCEGDDGVHKFEDNEAMLSHKLPVLVGVGLFSCAVLMQQILQDLAFISSSFKLIFYYHPDDV